MLVVLNIIAILLLPFIFTGLITRTKSFWAGRTGPPLFQPFYDFLKLSRKSRVVSFTSGYIFSAAPIFCTASTLMAALLIPVFGGRSLIQFHLDFILFIYMLALGKFLQILSALDTGSSFEGMGASREATFNAVAEPGLFILIAALSATAGVYSFSGFLMFIHSSSLLILVKVLSACVFFILLLVEGNRVPFDDPTTHLELTMVHEVMVLDNSGPDLALIHYNHALKIFLFALLIANLLLPSSAGPGQSALILSGILIAQALVVGTLESFFARTRMSHVPQYIFIIVSLAMSVMLVTLLFTFGGVK